ncbi:MAG TPA: T9SS type A sorting domain-containing protein [Clostridiales bacterium]|nr:T9SS type A sorting domain-containing protein [Clostridiales bacterium]HQP70906.1 T9SS type A sorting domain-containing protein [Clostridiales bacterium]
MKIFIYAVLLLTVSAYSVITFEKTIGGTSDDEANSIRQTFDGGYIIAGYSSDSLFSGMTLFKTDHSGNQEWRKTTGYGMNEGYSVIETKDSCFVIAGYYVYSVKKINMVNLIYIEKTDKNGNTLWTYEQPYQVDDEWYENNYEAYEIIQTCDGGYAATGSSFFGYFIIKLDSLGNEEWLQTDSTEFTESCGRSIIQTEDKGFVITGYSPYESTDSRVISLIKTDSLGNREWIKYFGGGILSTGISGHSVKRTPDNGYILFGTTGNWKYGDLAILIKTDSNGEKEWDKSFGVPDSQGDYNNGKCVDITSNGGYILTGYMDHPLGGPDSYSWLIKTDSEGNVIWEKTFGPEYENNERLHSVQQTTDGGYIIAGYTDAQGAGGKDMWIIKTDENGTEIESPFLPQNTELYQNYPNPFNPTTTISYALSQAGQVELSVYNLNGQLVNTLVNCKQDKGIHKADFDAGDLTSGLYIYSLKVDGKIIQSRKLMLLK